MKIVSGYRRQGGLISARYEPVTHQADTAIIIITPSPQQQPPSPSKQSPDKFSCYDWLSFCGDFLEDG